MEPEIIDTLEEVLSGISAGGDMADIISESFQVESGLGPLLGSMDAAHSLSSVDVPVKTINRSRTRVLARAAQLRQERKSVNSVFRRIPRLAYALALAVVLALMSYGGLSIVSAKALPGDQLYPLKRATENIRLGLSVTLEDHHAVEDRYKLRRIEEVNSLIASGRSEFVEFYGKVNQQGENSWNIGGVDVRLSPDTIIIGDIFIGMVVEVEGVTVPDGWVQASEIHLQTYGFMGYVESISAGVWQISGKTIYITPESRVDSAVQVGDWVVVSVRSDDFGVLTALIIDASSLPAPTPIPTLDPDSAAKTSVPTPSDSLNGSGDETGSQDGSEGEGGQEFEDSPGSGSGEAPDDEDEEDGKPGDDGDDSGDEEDEGDDSGDDAEDSGDDDDDGDDSGGDDDDGDDSGDDDDDGDDSGDEEDEGDDEDEEEPGEDDSEDEEDEEDEGDEPPGGEDDDEDDERDRGRGD
jgi:hypothetical protein